VIVVLDLYPAGIGGAPDGLKRDYGATIVIGESTGPVRSDQNPGGDVNTCVIGLSSRVSVASGRTRVMRRASISHAKQLSLRVLSS
jgi:hypothetical protein